ncbi:MAG: hypothetical protein V3V33_10175 [Candidatus Lokiarchaeia archaeon]
MVQDKGISATHPIIFKKIGKKIIVCSVSENKRYNYSIVLPFTRIKNWESNDKNYFLQCINKTNYYLDSSAGHELAMEYGIAEKEITDSKKYIKS